MTKKELVAYVAEKANLSKKDAEIAVNSVFDGITEALKTIEIPAGKAPSFKAGKALKDTIK